MNTRWVTALLTAGLLVGAPVAPLFARVIVMPARTGPSVVRSGPVSPSLVYVANAPLNSITAYEAAPGGGVTPVLTLAGRATGLDGPAGLTFDSEGRLYVVNHGSTSSVTVYAPYARGNAAPLWTLAGPKTHLNASSQPADYPTGAIAVDLSQDRLYVARISNEQSPYNRSVLVFRAGAGGDSAPIASIGPVNAASGPATWTSPGIAFEAGQVVVGTNLSDCCHSSDGWIYYNQSNLAPVTNFMYYENDNVYGLAVAPRTGQIADIFSGQIEVWPAGISGTALCNVCAAQLAPLKSLNDPLGAGFTSVAVDANDTIWALSGSNALEAFSLTGTTPRVITGLTGSTAIAVTTLGFAPCGQTRCSRPPFAR